MKKLLKGEDLMTISELLISNGYDENIEIVISVDDKATLRKINEDFFYRFANADGKAGEIKDDDVDEVLINVAGINFKYVVKENNE